MEQSIGTTELRQRLTDVLQAVREGEQTYIVETFDRAQAALVSLDEYRRFQRFQRDQAKSPEELEPRAASDSVSSPGVSYEEVVAIINQVRDQVTSGALNSDEQIEVIETIARLLEKAFLRHQAEPPTAAFQRILQRATDLGVDDLSERHNHYLYDLSDRLD